VQHIGRGHKQHLRQVVVHVEIVVLEGGVLLRVQHFKQRRGRIAAEVRGHLVHFVQQEDGFLVPARFMCWMICPGSAPM
jgi:hypothetical protein